MHPHESLIDALGGPTKVARDIELELELDEGKFSSQTVSNWKRRGVPPDIRQTVANIALRKGVAVPEGFLKPCHRRRAVAVEPYEPKPVHQPPATDEDIPAFLRRAV